MMKPENHGAKEMEDENDDDLIDCLSQYLLNHVNGEQWVRLLVGLAIEQDWGGRVRRERKRGKGIHDDVNPKQLYSAQHPFFRRRRQSSDKCDDDSCNVC